MVVLLLMYIVGGALLLLTIVGGVARLVAPSLRSRREQKLLEAKGIERYKMIVGYPQQKRDGICYICSKQVNRETEVYDPRLGWIHIDCYDEIFRS